jgi:hypothetical protein
MKRSKPNMHGILQHVTFVSTQHMPLNSAYLCEIATAWGIAQSIAPHALQSP